MTRELEMTKIGVANTLAVTLLAGALFTGTTTTPAAAQPHGFPADRFGGPAAVIETVRDRQPDRRDWHPGWRQNQRLDHRGDRFDRRADWHDGRVDRRDDRRGFHLHRREGRVDRVVERRRDFFDRRIGD